ncbi:hypothetical protein FO519_003123 [Halicephalobus sp. NKZ332]|nr:hypothetical protein FO519_003123 [Halicephalobus sp. NKZ332]
MMESEEVVNVDDGQQENVHPEDEESNNLEKKEIETLLPLSRIKKICKLDPDVHMLTSDALKIVTFSVERFIECLAKEASLVSREDGRKTVQIKDIDRAIRRNPLFEFLEDALSDWPESDAPGGLPQDQGQGDEAANDHEDVVVEDVNEHEDVIIEEDENGILEEDDIQDDHIVEGNDDVMDTEEPRSLDGDVVEDPVDNLQRCAKIKDIEDL